MTAPGSALLDFLRTVHERSRQGYLPLFSGDRRDGASVKQIEKALNLDTATVKAWLWNEMDNGRILRHGRCMDEAVFTCHPDALRAEGSAAKKNAPHS